VLKANTFMQGDSVLETVVRIFDQQYKKLLADGTHWCISGTPVWIFFF